MGIAGQPSRQGGCFALAPEVSGPLILPSINHGKVMLLLRLWESGNRFAIPKAAPLPAFPQPGF